MSATPISLRTLGPRQKELLLRAKWGPLRADNNRDRQSCLRLHEKGLLARGASFRDYLITEKGECVANG